ncbi:nitrogen regulation protein NR(II) [Aestuariibacter salexigens]|uniref:nitrogen regulation protein NR(II) n=1 Tax=Aestuariibacter salexigens TaxID=226010 RepID=UPI0003F63890|nr:nitrogen regulation protein NR(II) [Aestuariibacter salexigens]
MPSQAGVANLLDSLSTALLMVDSQFHIVFVNHASQRFLARSENQLLGKPLREFFFNTAIDRARLQRVLDFGEEFTETEVRIAFADGRQTLADVTVSHVASDDGPRLLFEVRQIDKQKRITQESQQWAQQKAARDLIRGLAHEIKNPLGGIRGAAQLLQKALQNDEHTEFTQMIIEQSDRLRNLVDRLLGPNSPPNFQWSNIHQALERVYALVKVDRGFDVTIERDYDPSIPEMYLDHEMIQQAVLNMVRNSMQALHEHAHPQPIIRLVTRIARQFTIHGIRYPLCAEIKIVDNGPGIPQAIADTLFYPMVSGKQNGSGLGLSIAQTLIDQHKGKIEVDSRPGETTFTLYLPINDRKPD